MPDLARALAEIQAALSALLEGAGEAPGLRRVLRVCGGEVARFVQRELPELLRSALAALPGGAQDGDGAAVAAFLERFLSRCYPTGDLSRHPARSVGPSDGAELRWPAAGQHYDDAAALYVHPDLGGALRSVLGDLLKDEVLRLSDVAGPDAPGPARELLLVPVLRAVAEGVIALLGRMEQRHLVLWRKPPLVTESHLCVTLDLVPADLYEEVARCEAQREAWVELFRIDRLPAYSVPLRADFLRRHQGLLLDTRHFPPALRDALLAGLPDLDGATDGLVVHGDNARALRLLRARFQGQVRCVYIDPPYNTGEAGFPYKDAYDQGAWLSLLEERLSLGRALQGPDGTLVVSIDDAELAPLTLLLRRVYGPGELAKLVWDRSRKNDARFFSVGHEYMLVYAVDAQHLSRQRTVFREPVEGLAQARARYQGLLLQHGTDWDAIRRGWRSYFADLPRGDPRYRLSRYCKVGPRGPYRDDGDLSWPGGGGPRYEVLHPRTGRPCKLPSRGWVYPTAERFWQAHAEGKVVFGADETTTPSAPRYLFERQGQVMPSVFYSYAQVAAQEFDALVKGLGPGRVFQNPKSWRDLARVLRYLGTPSGWVLDYFAGSGSTAHAVLQLNREDGGRRRYLLVESAPYFDSLLLRRIQRAVYASEWQAGEPVSQDGLSQVLRYVRLESYADAMAALSSADDSAEEQADERTLRYVLDAGGPRLVPRRLRSPFRCVLAAGQGRAVPVDLVETFSYLLGLLVRRVVAGPGWRLVRGVSPEGKSVLVLWRDVEQVPDAALAALWQDGADADVIYVNGGLPALTDRPADRPVAAPVAAPVLAIEDELQRLLFLTAGPAGDPPS